MAVNCCVVPSAIEGLVGVTPIDTNTAGVTLSVVESEMSPSVALTVVAPMLKELARPLEPAALEMVATAVFEEAQVTKVVKFCVELSEKVPVAVNC